MQLIELIIWGAAIGIGVLILIFFLIWIIKSFLYICPPNEVLIFSGGRSRTRDGKVRGYREVFGGRAFKIPIFEKVDRMSLNTMEVPISVRHAYSQGGVPLNVDAIANVKISSDPQLIGNAIERFLGRDPNEIRRVAKETLEGHLRGVLARLTPEEVNEDRLKFADELGRESELDLNKLGIHLDTLKIQHVSDEQQYLNSIGREAIANVIRSAEIAESDARRSAEQAEAQNQARGKVKQEDVEAHVAQRRNELRKIRADLEAEVRSEEEQMLAAAREARAKAEQELQQLRAQLEEIRLQVEQILPAEADRQAEEYLARGEAAILRERGIAVSQALMELNKAWRDAGENALSIAVLADFDKIVNSSVRALQNVDLGEVKIIDSGSGESMANFVAMYPAMLSAIFDSVKTTTGIDIPKAIRPQTEAAAEKQS
jgi:flotillin